ncbi:unnamed protein product [Merluccius merluccius]
MLSAGCEMEDKYTSKLSPAVDIGAGIYLVVIAGLSIAGNTLVLVTSYRRSSSMKPPELLSVNLALTDLGAAVIMYPLAVVSAWNHRWLGGDATCIYYGLLGFFFGMASIMNLTVMAIVRLYISVNQQSNRERISWRTVKALCAWTWLYGLTWALFPIMGWGRYGPEPFGLSCSLAWVWMKEDGFTFVISVFVLNLVFPFVVIVFCYSGISLKLYFTYRNSSIRGLQISNIVKLHHRLLIIAVLISAGFIICWLPYGMVSLWYVLVDGAVLPPEVTLLPCLFAKSSTVYNPIIYYTFSKSFKREVKRLGTLCTGACCTPAATDATDNRHYVARDQNNRCTVISNTQFWDTNC